jgi:hypothetical protein
MLTLQLFDPGAADQQEVVISAEHVQSMKPLHVAGRMTGKQSLCRITMATGEVHLVCDPAGDVMSRVALERRASSRKPRP